MAAIVVTLSEPVQFGSERIESLELKPTGRALRDFTLPMSAEGKIDYQPWALAVVGLRMAGRHAGAEKIADSMSVPDLSALAQAVLSFFVAPTESGKTP